MSWAWLLPAAFARRLRSQLVRPHSSAGQSGEVRGRGARATGCPQSGPRGQARRGEGSRQGDGWLAGKCGGEGS